MFCVLLSGTTKLELLFLLCINLFSLFISPLFLPSFTCDFSFIFSLLLVCLFSFVFFVSLYFAVQSKTCRRSDEDNLLCDCRRLMSNLQLPTCEPQRPLRSGVPLALQCGTEHHVRLKLHYDLILSRLFAWHFSYLEHKRRLGVYGVRIIALNDVFLLFVVIWLKLVFYTKSSSLFMEMTVEILNTYSLSFLQLVFIY